MGQIAEGQFAIFWGTIPMHCDGLLATFSILLIQMTFVLEQTIGPRLILEIHVVTFYMIKGLLARRSEISY